MARSVTVVVKLANGSNHAAGVEFNTSSVDWVKREPGNANYVFTTARGPYRIVGASTELLRPGGGLRVGRLENLDPATVANGSTGQGLSDDVGSAVTWKVEGIIEL